MAESVKFFDGHKFMWDGKEYESEDEAKKVQEEYIKNNFETRLIQEGNKFLVYTRRVVKEIVLEGPPPV